MTLELKFFSRAKVSKTFALFLSLFAVTGCATYQTHLSETRNMLAQQKADIAAESLRELAYAEGKDQLVYLLDYGTVNQIAGNIEESNKAFLAADQIAEVKDYHSISKVSASLLFSEEMVQYKGDDYEKVIINAMLAVNFLMQGQLDGALVETRRLNEKLHHYRVDGKKDYEQSPFAFYLAAMIWEADKKWDDAYIDYKKVYELDPSIDYLKKDLVRAAYFARRPDELKKWQKQFGVEVNPEWKNKELGEIVLVYQQGWGPRKYPHPDSPRFPKLYPVPTQTVQAQLIVEDGPTELTQQIYSVEEIAIRTLNDEYDALVAKRIAALATKEVVADQIRQKNQGLGDLAWLAMHLSDRADLRQWSTLPETFQVARVTLPAGTYKISVQGLGRSGAPTHESLASKEVVVRPGKKSFIGWRSFH